MLSDEIYMELVTSEQAPTDRNKRDLNHHGAKDPNGFWDKVVDYFLDENLVLGGIQPGNPVSHAASTAEGVAKMWETLQSLDYKALAKKWKEEWEFKDGDKKGQVDKGKAREKILGWWKDMRSEYRVAVKNVGKSGE
ncbi:unnamed protein product, partial [Pylaiella littoralis]